MPPQVLKTTLGHSSLAMTMDLYSHVMEDVKVDEMEKIAKVFQKEGIRPLFFDACKSTKKVPNCMNEDEI